MTIDFKRGQSDERELLREQNLLLLQQMDLQWFGPEDEGRTEDPTDHKVRKSREEGKVAKSADLASSIVLLFCVLSLGIFGKYLLKGVGDILIFYLSEASQFDITGRSNLLALLVVQFAKVIVPFVAIAFVAAIIGNVAQFGFLFSTKPITPDFKKIVPNFGKFFSKSFMSGEAIFNLGKALFKVAVVAMISFVNIWIRLETIVGLLGQPIWSSFSFLAGTIFTIMIEASLVFLLLAIPDFFFQKKQHMDSLKMTKQEVKQEHKEFEGDPLVKNRLRERMREILSGNMIRNVPDADVVITNPTHYAVALQYDRSTMGAPVVLAKGEDHLALRIREIARENAVPMVENKPLARTLYEELEPGDEIPEQYYEAIALVLREIYEMNGMIEEAV